MSGLAGLRAQNAPDMDSLMARTFSYVLRNGLRNDGFSSEVYVQHHLYTRRRGVLMRYLPGGLRLEKGKNEYFGESLSKYQFMPPAQIDRKDLAAFSTMPYVEQPRDQWLGNYSMSIYEPNLFSNGLLSPFNAINRRYYRYKYIYSYDDPERRVACVHIEPRIWNSQLVRGTADIDEATGAVRRFSFDFYYGWAHLHVTGTLGKDGRSSLLPEKISVDSDMKVLGNVLVDRFDAVVKYDFNRPEEQAADDSLKQRNRFDLTEQCRLHVDTTSVRRDLAFFEEHRPVALTKEQRDIYERAASAKRTTTDSLKNASFQPLYQTAENIFLDSHSLQLGDHGTLRLPPLLTPSMVEWSRGDGISLRTRLSFDFPLSQKSRLQFRPQVGYNFRQKRVYWECPLQLRFLPKYDGCLSIQAAGGEYIYNSKQADEVREKLEGITHYDSLLQVFNRYDFHYYRDSRFLAEVSFQPVVGLRLAGGLRYHQRRMLGWNELADRTGMKRTLQGLAPRLQMEWTPAQYYYRDNDFPVPLYSSWPTFLLSYERSIASVDANTRYERIEFDASYRLRMHALRSLYFRVGSGLYTVRADDCFLYYDNFRYRSLQTAEMCAFTGQFQLLDSRWYNESDYYLRFSAAYESPMLLFSRIRHLTRVVEREYLFCNLLNVRALDFYSEFGYGISLPLLQVAVFGAVAGKKQSAIGCKVAFRLGDYD